MLIEHAAIGHAASEHVARSEMPLSHGNVPKDLWDRRLGSGN